MNQKRSGGAMPFDSRGSTKLKPGTVPGLTNKQTILLNLNYTMLILHVKTKHYSHALRNNSSTISKLPLALLQMFSRRNLNVVFCCISGDINNDFSHDELTYYYRSPYITFIFTTTRVPCLSRESCKRARVYSQQITQ